MYHCQFKIYLLGQGRGYFNLLKDMLPLEHFTHLFLESERAEEKLVMAADAIFVDAPSVDVSETLKILKAAKSGVKIVMLAESVQIPSLSEEMHMFEDIWTLPMTEKEFRFRFLRFQQLCKKEKDAWQNSQYLETTLSSTPSLIWYKDKNGLHEKVNDSFCQVVRKTKEDVTGKDHYYIWDVDPNDPANEGFDCMASDREVMRKQEVCAREELVKSGDEMKLLMTYKAPLYDLDGTVMGTAGVGVDITQERAYEEDIVQKNRTLEMIFATLECGVIYHTVDGSDVLSINQAALEILGYDSKEELMADGFHMIASSVVDKEALRNSISTLQKPGDSVGVEYRVQHKNGKIAHVLGNIKMIQENGVLYYRRFLLDVTAQKLKEKEDKKHQLELIHALSIDYSLVLYFNLDTEEGRMLRETRKSSSLFDVSNSENIMLGESLKRYIEHFVCEEDKQMMTQVCARESLKKELDKRELYYVSFRALIDKEIKYYEMKAVRTGAWEVDHSIVLGFRSVDEAVRSEMKQKVLLEEALRQANKASQAKSLFLSNMSHDIRTPMNAIIGFTTLAKNHADDPDQVKKYLDKITTSGNHMLELINDVLDMSRIESGKMQLEEASCRLSDILDGLKSMLQINAHKKQLEFKLEKKNVEHEDIICDKMRLSQVLINILSNSVKYTNPGGKVYMLVTEKPSMQSDFANYEIRIKDNGIGMSEEFLLHIYEPFEREKNTTVSGIQGTGLGMPIAKNIVDMMNGTICIKSRQNVGTETILTFSFRIPLESEQEKLKLQSGDTLLKKDQIIGRRILMAEDNELNQEIAVEILSSVGFEIEVAENGRIALEMLQNSEPGYYDIVLMDVQMPVMNGYEASRAIRGLANPKLASIPIFAMTANAFEEDKLEARKNGMNGHIAKPIDMRTLIKTLKEALAQGGDKND